MRARDFREARAVKDVGASGTFYGRSNKQWRTKPPVFNASFWKQPYTLSLLTPTSSHEMHSPASRRVLLEALNIDLGATLFLNALFFTPSPKGIFYFFA